MKKAVFLSAMLTAVLSLAQAAQVSAPFADEPSWVSDDAYGVGSMTFGDLNSDGLLDLAIGTYSAGYPPNKTNKFVFLNKGGMLETKPSWMSDDERYTPDACWGDFNKDGFMDLLSVNGGPAGHPITLHLGSVAGLEKSPSWIAKTAISSQHLAVADVNNDGFLDFFTANLDFSGQGMGMPALGYLSQGAMVDTKYSWRSGYRIQGMGIALGDIDGDGLKKGMAEFRGDGKQRLFVLQHHNILSIDAVEIDGKSVPFAATASDPWIALPVAPSASSEPNVTVHYTASTDMDMAVLDMKGINIHLNENGTFMSGASYEVKDSPMSPRLLKLIDIDGDGDLDLFVGGHSGPMMMFANEGGRLEERPFWYSKDTAVGSQDAVFADIDQDGDQDLFIITFTSNKGLVQLFLNDGSRLSTEPDWIIRRNGASGTSLALADLNLDGKLDLAIAHANAKVQVYLNRR